MQIPDSIEKLTALKPPTSFTDIAQPRTIDINELILLLKKTLPVKEQESLEQGLAFFNPDVSSDKQIIKNFLKLLCESYTNAINNSNINQEYIENAKFSLKQIFESTIQNTDSIFSLIKVLNEQNNLLDSKQISLIILGYAIGTIKKIYNS